MDKNKTKAFIKQMQSVIALIIIFVVASFICVKDGVSVNEVQSLNIAIKQALLQAQVGTTAVSSSVHPSYILAHPLTPKVVTLKVAGFFNEVHPINII